MCVFQSERAGVSVMGTSWNSPEKPESTWEGLGVNQNSFGLMKLISFWRIPKTQANGMHLATLWYGWLKWFTPPHYWRRKCRPRTRVAPTYSSVVLCGLWCSHRTGFVRHSLRDTHILNGATLHLSVLEGWMDQSVLLRSEPLRPAIQNVWTSCWAHRASSPHSVEELNFTGHFLFPSLSFARNGMVVTRKKSTGDLPWMVYGSECYENACAICGNRTETGEEAGE